MAVAFVAATLVKLAHAEDEWADDGAKLVDELLADDQEELRVKGLDFSNHTWKEFVSILCHETGPLAPLYTSSVELH